MQKRDKIAVISTGNGGQSFAAYFAHKGQEVALYAREQERVDMFPNNRFEISGVINEGVVIDLISCDMEEVVRGARLIMVTTPSHYHSIVATAMAPYLEDGQIIVLNPGRTFGCYEFDNVLKTAGCAANVILAETDTFIFTCRVDVVGCPQIFHIKSNVLAAALDPKNNLAVQNCLLDYFDSIHLAQNVFETGFLNIGMVFHPMPVLTNLTRIEAKERFKYYHGAITPTTAEIMQRLDDERVAVARAAGVRTLTACEWLRDRYGSYGDTLYECIQNNASYAEIYTPTTLNTRYINEDVRTGCVPISCVGRELGVPTPVIDSVIAWASSVYNVDLYATGRNADKMGIQNLLADLENMKTNA